MKKSIYKVLSKLNHKRAYGLVGVMFLSFGILTMLFNQSVQAAWIDIGWNFRKQLVIDAGQVSGSADLINFPVLVKFSDPQLSNNAQADGDDILFTSADGVSQLDHEIEYFDSANGSLVAWVEIPTLDYNDNTTIYMYYGNPTATNQEDVNGTWKSEYEAVWHMAEASSATRTDSTDGGLDLSNGNSVDQAVGIAGYSADFENGDDDYLSRSNASAGALNVGDEDFTFSFWMNMETYTSTNRVFGKFNASQESYAMSFQTVSGQRVIFDVSPDGTSNIIKRNDNATVAAGTWHHIVLSHDATNDVMIIWVDGVSDFRVHSTGVFNSSADFNIGRIQALGGTFDFDGKLDEFRMLSEVPTSDWVTTEYNNVSNPTGFFSQIGDPESIDDPIVHFNFDENRNDSCPGGEDSCNSSGNYANGIFTGVPTWQPSNMCVSGNCVYLDGSDDEIIVSNVSQIDQDGGLIEGFTYQAWVKINSDGENDEGRIFNSATSTFIQVQSEGSDGLADLYFSADLASADATLTIADAIKLNSWHHIAMSYTDDADDEITVYIDGIEGGTSSDGNGSPSTSTNDLVLGGMNSSTSRNYHGFIDSFKLYDYERTAGQVKSDFIRGAGPNGSVAVFGMQDTSFLNHGLVGYWKMDEASGDIADSSGNGYTLTNNSTVAFTGARFGNGSEHVPASSEYFSTVTTFNDVSTVSFWANPDSTTNYYVALTSGAYITSSGGTVSTTGLTNATIYVDGEQATSIISDTWQHVTVTFDSIDATQLYVGRQGTNYYDGTLDEVRLYNRTLSSSEVNALYTWAPGPVGYWNFDENSGTTSVYDKSNNVYDLVLTSAAETDWTPGKYGSGLRFDGSSDYATASSENGNFSSNIYTVSGWIYRTTDSGGVEAIVDNRDADNDGWVLTIDTSDTITCSYNSVDVTSVSTISINTWNHVGCTADGADIRVYFNGIEENSATQSGSISESTDTRIATQSYGVSQQFAGIIDEVRVYTYARNSSQIVEDMNGGHPVGGSPVGSQISKLDFDETYGDTAHDSISNNNGDLGGSDTSCPTTGDCPSWVRSGKIGSALDFDGSDDQVTVSNNISIDLNNSLASSFTFSTWINPDSDGEGDAGQLFNKGTNTYCRTDSQGTTDLDLECSLDLTTADATLNIPDALTVDRWHHVAVSYTDDADDEITIWVDGVARGTSVNGSGAPAVDTNDLSIGGSTSNNFDGTIDVFKIYSTELSTEQMAIDMNANAAINFGTGSDEAEQLEEGAGNLPVGYWPMDENTGTSTTSDKSGNGNNASFVGSMIEADWIPGKYGSALDLDGVDDELTVTNTNVIDQDGGLANEVTIATWVYVRSDGEDNQGRVFHKLANTYIQVENEASGAVDVRFSYHLLNNSATVVITDGFSLNQWHHVAMTYEDDADDEITVYIDGVNRGTSSNGSGSSGADTADLVIGGMSGNSARNFDGLIDEFKVYDYVRSQSQIAYDYNRGDPVAWWRFDECSGATIYDSSGHGNNGTILPGDSSGSNDSVGMCNSGNADEMWNNGVLGKYNSSLDFDGANDYILVPDDNSLDISGSFTISVWVNPSTMPGAGNYESIISKDSQYTSVANYFFELNDSNDFNCGFYNGLTYKDNDFPNTITTGTWQHLVCVFNDELDTVTGYKDGILVGTNPESTNPVTNSLELLIGAFVTGPSQFIDAKIDDLRIYNYALSNSQVRSIMNHNSVRFGN